MLVTSDSYSGTHFIFVSSVETDVKIFQCEKNTKKASSATYYGNIKRCCQNMV